MSNVVFFIIISELNEKNYCSLVDDRFRGFTVLSTLFDKHRWPGRRRVRSVRQHSLDNAARLRLLPERGGPGRPGGLLKIRVSQGNI